MLKKRTTGWLMMNRRLAKVASFHIWGMDGGRFGGDYSISAASTLSASTGLFVEESTYRYCKTLSFYTMWKVRRLDAVFSLLDLTSSGIQQSPTTVIAGC